MNDLLGYLGVVLSLTAIAMKNMMRLRIVSFLANFTYMVYAVLVEAYPILVGCFIALCIHSYHIYKLKKIEKKETFANHVK